MNDSRFCPLDGSEGTNRAVSRIGSVNGTKGSKKRKWAIRRMVNGDWNILCRNLDSETKKWCDYSTIDYDVEFRVEDGWTDGFFVAEDVETGQLLGHAVATKHGVQHGYVGVFFVHDSASGTDVGLGLIRSATDYLKGRNILADFRLTDFAVPRYETELLSLFKESNWSTLRYVGVPKWDHLPSQANQQMYVCHAQMILVEDLAAFDRTISGENRLPWLRRFVRHSNEGWIPRSAQLVVTDRRGDIRGYGCVRPGAVRARIGPIYARDSKTFLLLFRNLMGSSRDARTRGVDVAVSSANRQAVDAMENVLGLQRLRVDDDTHESKRFFTKWHPHVVLEQAYCLSNCFTQFI